MASIQKYTDLIVWQKSHQYVLDLYRVTKGLPASEAYGLTSQVRRSAVSVPSNIVEGFERGSSKEFKQFLIIARASLAESQSQLLIARDLEFISKSDFDKLASISIEVHKMINALIKSIATRQLATNKLKD